MSGNIAIDLFQKLDLRIAKIVKTERIPGKTKIYKAQIDVGDQQVQTIVGGADYYPPEYFDSKTVVILLNLEPKVIAGVQSKGMLLAADIEGKPVWLTVDEHAPAGTKVR